MELNNGNVIILFNSLLGLIRNLIPTLSKDGGEEDGESWRLMKMREIGWKGGWHVQSIKSIQRREWVTRMKYYLFVGLVSESVL